MRSNCASSRNPTRARKSASVSPGNPTRRDEIDLFRALSLELLRFAHETAERLGPMLAPHQGNGAERAGVIAAFRDFQIAHMRLRAEELPHAGMCGDRIGNQPALRQLRDEVMQLGESVKQIDFGN